MMSVQRTPKGSSTLVALVGGSDLSYAWVEGSVSLLEKSMASYQKTSDVLKWCQVPSWVPMSSFDCSSV